MTRVNDALDTLVRFSAIFEKRRMFCDFLFAFLHAKPLLKRGLVYKDRILEFIQKKKPFIGRQPFDLISVQLPAFHGDCS